MRRGLWLRLCVLWLCAAGCGDDDDAADDAATVEVDATVDPGDAGFDAYVPIVPMAPAMPALPVLTPCAQGWREEALADAGITVCQPWPAAVTCSAPDQAQFPGEPACVRVGSTCPIGDFPDGLPVGATVVHVRAGATAGNGTMAQPYGTLAAAIAAAPAGAIVAVSRGTYRERVELASGITLWGACVSGTVLDAAGDGSRLMRIATGTATVKNLTLAMALDVNGGSLSVTDVVARPRVSVTGSGRLSATNLVVAGLLGVTGGGVVEATRAVVGPVTTQPAVSIAGAASQVTLNDTALWGDFTLQGGSLEMNRSRITQEISQRLTIGASVRFADSMITGPATVLLEAPSRMTLQRTTIEVLAIGGNSLGPGPLDLEDVVFLGGGHPGGLPPIGAPTTARRLLMTGQAGPAIGAGGVFQDLTVKDSRLWGMSPPRNKRVVLERALFQRTGQIGLLLESGTQLEASDLTIEDTRAIGPYGMGIQAIDSQLTLERVALRRNVTAGIYADGTTTVSARDLVVEQTGPPPCAATDCPQASAFGTGLGAYGTATFDVTDFVSSQNNLCGVQLGPKGQMDLHRGIVRGNTIGANVQNPSFDARRLSDRVIFENAINLDSVILTIPPPVVVP